MELRSLLQQSREATRDRLAEVLGCVPDPQSRLDRVGQLERAWFRRRFDERAFAAPERLVLRLLLGERHGVHASELPEEGAELVRGGWLFADDAGRLHLPDALRLCLAPTPSDAPKALRLLLPRLSPDDARALSRTHHATPVHGAPHALLERSLGVLLDEGHVRRSYEALADDARRLLDAALERAGELDVQEILVLEREPARIRVGGAPQLPRHSRAYVLARAGLLLSPQGMPWLVPEEVFRALTREAYVAHAAQLVELAARNDEDEPLPARAIRAGDAGAAAAALLAVLDARGALREGVGVARSTLERTARDLGIAASSAPLLASVGRAAGLPFGEGRLDEVASRLWHAWRSTRAWNEELEEPDGFRHRARSPAPSASLAAAREALLEALRQLPEHRFATRDEILRVAARSARVGEGRREVLVRILDGSMPALGMLDVGESDGARVVRASGRLRAWLASGRAVGGPLPEAAPQAGVQRVVADASMRGLRTLSRVARLWVDEGGICCTLDPAELGLEAAERGWGALLETLPATISIDEDALKALAVPPLEADWWVLQGALRVTDPELRRRLFEDRAAAEVFVDLEGAGELLLVRQGASDRRVRALLRRYGVVVPVPRKASDRGR